MRLHFKPTGVFLIGVFFLLSVIIVETAAVSLLFPNTFLAKIWSLNPGAYQQIIPFRLLTGYGFLILGIVFIFAAIGWMKRRKWGWWLVISIFLVNGISDGIHLIMGDMTGGIIGLSVAGGLLFYLTRPKIKRLFE